MWSLLVLAVMYVILKFLNLTEQPRSPTLFFHKGDSFVNKVLQLCPIFNKPYVPPMLWGKNGHLQTFVFGKASPCFRINNVKTTSRHSVKLEDNSTVIFDIFQSTAEEKSKITDDFTIIVVPGIANDSNASYIQSFCEYSTSLGYRVVVLNHLGVLPVKLTSKRIFTYGSTCELRAIVNFVASNYPDTNLIGVGFSMGANILVKYLGENIDQPRKFLCAVSICQGYDILKACPALEEWDGLRRVYNWLITQRVKQMMKRHLKELFSGGKSTGSEQLFQRNKVLMATSLKEIDENFVREMAGYQTVTDYYSDNSSSRYINNVDIPMLLLNSKDDPLIPPDQLLDTPKNYVKRPGSQSLFVLSQFGGHLAFYEGGLFTCHSQTWLNKAILQYVNAVVEIKGQDMKPHLWK